VLVSTERGRQRERNVQRNPLVCVCIIDSEDLYRYVSVRGPVEKVTVESADDHADALAQQYMGVEAYPNREERGERVVLRVEPLRVTGTGQA
jgi:Pyridoxamine 5''-phosphate oxidase.